MTSDGAQLEESFLTVPGGRLWVEQAGRGPPLVFVHAGIADRRMWDHQVAELTDHYRVVRYDQRGFGQSDRSAEPFSPVADLDAVLDFAGVAQAALVGCSVGGAIVIDYTLAHPERVTALVPVAAGVSGFPWQPMPEEAELEAAVKANDLDRIAQAAIRMWAPLRTDPVVDERIRRLLVDNLAGLTTLGTMWLDSPPAYGRLNGIRVPTLVVVGDHDQNDFARVAELMAAEINEAQLVVLPNVDHNVPMRAAAAFTELLASFLDELGRWP